MGRPKARKGRNGTHVDRSAVSELAFAIQHLCHAEVHLVESMSMNLDDPVAVGMMAKEVESVRSERVLLMEKLSESAPAVRGAWCAVKHLLSAEFHLFELYGKTGDASYLGRIEASHLAIDRILDMDRLGSLRKCPICGEKGRDR